MQTGFPHITLVHLFLQKQSKFLIFSGEKMLIFLLRNDEARWLLFDWPVPHYFFRKNAFLSEEIMRHAGVYLNREHLVISWGKKIKWMNAIFSESMKRLANFPPNNKRLIISSEKNAYYFFLNKWWATLGTSRDALHSIILVATGKKSRALLFLQICFLKKRWGIFPRQERPLIQQE